MLTGLRHRTISSRNNQDRAVHLGSTGDHVLHIVSVTWAVDVCIVTVCGFILDVCRRDRDAAGALFRSRVDLVIRLELAEKLRDRCRQRRLAVVNVTNRADVNVGLRTFEFAFCHRRCSLCSRTAQAPAQKPFWLPGQHLCQNGTANRPSMIPYTPNRSINLERVAGIEPAYSAWKAAALPLSYTRALLTLFRQWWRELDLNQRRHSQRIYSPSPLTTRASLQISLSAESSD